MQSLCIDVAEEEPVDDLDENGERQIRFAVGRRLHLPFVHHTPHHSKSYIRRNSSHMVHGSVWQRPQTPQQLALDKEALMELELEKHKYIQILGNGLILRKVSSKYQHKARFFWVSEDGTEICYEKVWEHEHRKKLSLLRRKPRRRLLADVECLLYGPHTQNKFGYFDLHFKSPKPWLCLSLVFAQNWDTLDLVCPDISSLELWFMGIQALIPLSAYHLTRAHLCWQRVKMKMLSARAQEQLQQESFMQYLIDSSEHVNQEILDRAQAEATARKEAEQRREAGVPTIGYAPGSPASAQAVHFPSSPRAKHAWEFRGAVGSPRGSGGLLRSPRAGKRSLAPVGECNYPPLPPRQMLGVILGGSKLSGSQTPPPRASPAQRRPGHTRARSAPMILQGSREGKRGRRHRREDTEDWQSLNPSRTGSVMEGEPGEQALS